MYFLSPNLAEPQHFALWERLLFAALAATSGVLFWRRFGPIIKKILHSRKDPGFRLFPIARRVWDFVWEVLCQSKVIRERPLPGLAHALVFWGFCAFALVTLNHLAIGFGTPFLPPRSFYFVFAAVFAVAVAISIAGLFFRRFLVRPKWLGELSYESGVIALLIFVLMTTYLATLMTDTTILDTN